MKTEHTAVTEARNGKDTTVLIISILIASFMISGYGLVKLIAALVESSSRGEALLGTFISESIYWGIWLVILLALLGVVMFIIRLNRQQFLASSLNVRYSDIAWLKDWSDKVAADINMPQLELFIVQEPYLNAFAFGFMKPYCIVLHSATIERLTNDELKAVVCHEMAHIKYKHTNISVYLAPLSAIPFFGVVVGWLFGFWSRRAELTADRLAVAYLRRPELMFQALLKIHMGPDVAKRASVEGVWAQLSESSNNLNKISESLGSHPFLVRRALSIYNFSQQQGIAWHNSAKTK